jgi:hypothetical protein
MWGVAGVRRGKGAESVTGGAGEGMWGAAGVRGGKGVESVTCGAGEGMRGASRAGRENGGVRGAGPGRKASGSPVGRDARQTSVPKTVRVLPESFPSHFVGLRTGRGMRRDGKGVLVK